MYRGFGAPKMIGTDLDSILMELDSFQPARLSVPKAQSTVRLYIILICFSLNIHWFQTMKRIILVEALAFLTKNNSLTQIE